MGAASDGSVSPMAFPSMCSVGGPWLVVTSGNATLPASSGDNRSAQLSMVTLSDR